MRSIKLRILGLMLGTYGCTFLPVTDLDASSSSGGVPNSDDTSGTGGATSGKGASSTGGSTYSGGASSNGGSQTGNAANTCTGTFTACGGDPTGTWDIVSVCVEGVLAAAANISYAQTLDQQSGTIATCSPGNSRCDCVYTTALPATADTYTVDGTSLVASDGSSTEFCVQGSTMTQRDSFGSNTYAVTQFRKR